MQKKVLEMKKICKSFAGVHALKGVDFSCLKGEIHCLAGENGAGKSTLLKILAGLFPADSGEIELHGEQMKFKNPYDAQSKGVAMVYQELTLIPEMTVWENIFLNIEPKTKFGFVDKKQILKDLTKIIECYDIKIDLMAVVKKLSVAQQQMTEILKILVHDPQVIILDEPTSSLAKKEVEKLYQIMRTMTQQGKTIIFISHRMEEIFTISDRITVLKDGELVGTREVKEINEDELVKMMIGRSLTSIFPSCNLIKENETIFSLKNMNIDNVVKDVNFDVKFGEVVGIAGLAGHGQTELLNGIAGILPKKTGQVFINNKEVNTTHPWNAISEGIALVPEDRKTEGLLLSLSIRKNLAVASLEKRKKFIFVDQKAEKKFVNDSVKQLSIKLANSENPVQSLSGGNQQKVVLGKGLAINPKVLLFNEPTRGIDIEAKSEFYSIMRDLAKEGVAIIICSSDLMEVVGMSDRVIVMYEGRISGELSKDQITEENIMRHAVGLK